MEEALTYHSGCSVCLYPMTTPFFKHPLSATFLFGFTRLWAHRHELGDSDRQDDNLVIGDVVLSIQSCSQSWFRSGTLGTCQDVQSWAGTPAEPVFWGQEEATVLSRVTNV